MGKKNENRLLNIIVDMQKKEIAHLEQAVKLTPLYINTHGNTAWGKADIDTIKSLLAEHYSGKISIYDYWGIGDEREIMLAGRINESVQMVLTDKGVYEKAENGHGSGVMCAFTVDQKNLLAETFHAMNETNTNKDGWECSEMRRWLNSVYSDAFPKEYADIFVPFIVEGGVDRFALRSEKELFGETEYSGDDEGRQIEYYKVTRNRVKCLGSDCSSSYYWWERSPSSGHSHLFCCVASSGSANSNYAGNPSGLAPFGCF